MKIQDILGFHRMMSAYEAGEQLEEMDNEIIRGNQPSEASFYVEENRPTEQAAAFELYKDFAIEHFPRSGKFRVAAPQPDTGQGRWGDGQGLKDIGLSFKFFGDACNYIDKYLIE